MSTIVERISVVVDTKMDQFKSGLASLKASVAEAEGLTGKFKAGLGSAVGSIKDFASSGAGMATIATVVGGALFKAGSAAEDLGLKVGDLADQTGLSAEEASRWLEVAGDMGISTEKLSGLMTKLAQNLGKSPEDFAKLGIAIVHAKDGTVDMNATLLGAIQVLHNTTDPTQKAALAAKLFGKGWKDASELISEGADTVKAKLAAVGGAKVFSDKNVKDARAARDALEDLKDVGSDLAMTLGKEVLPMFVAIAKDMKAAVDATKSLDHGIEGLTGHGLGDWMEHGLHGTQGLISGLDGLSSTMDLINDKPPLFEHNLTDSALKAIGVIRDGLVPAEGEMTAATDTARDSMFQAAAAADDLEGNARKVADNLWDAGENARHAKVEMDKLLGSIDKDEAWQNLMLDVEGLNGQLAGYAQAVKDGSMTQQEAMRRSALAIDATKSSLIDYYTKYEHIPPSVVTKVVADASAANLTMDQLAARLANLARLASTISFDNHTSDTPTTKNGKKLQSFDGGRTGGSDPNGDVYLQLDGATLMVFKNALANLDRGTR